MEDSFNEKIPTATPLSEESSDNFKSFAEPLLKLLEKELYKLYEANVKLKAKNKQLKQKINKLQKRSSIDLEALRSSIFKRRSISVSRKASNNDDVHMQNESSGGEQQQQPQQIISGENSDQKFARPQKSARKHRSIAHRLGLDSKSQQNDVALVSSLKAHNDIIWNVTTDLFQNNVYLMFTCSADSTCKISLMDTSESIETVVIYKGHSSSVNSMSFNSKSPGLMCTGSGNGSAHLWSYRTLYDTMVGDEDNTTVTSGNYTEFCSEAGIKEIPTPLINIKAHELPISTVEWNKNGVDFLTASWDENIKIWDSDKQECIKTLHGHSNEVTTAHYGTAENIVISGSADQTIRVWDIREPKTSVEICHAHSNVVTSIISAYHNEHLMISSGKDKVVRTWDRRNLSSYVNSSKFGSPINKISLTSNDSTICIPEDNGHIWLCNIKLDRLCQLTNIVSKKRPKASAMCSDWVDHSSFINVGDKQNNVHSKTKLISADNTGNVYCWKVSLSVEKTHID